MAEKDFQAAVAAGFSRYLPQAHYFKIPDFPMAPLQKAMAAAGQQLKMRTPKKPYDCLALIHGVYFALELKQSRGLSLGKNDLRDHQELALMQVEANSGVGLVCVNFQLKLSQREATRRGIPELDAVYAAPISWVIDAREQLCSDAVPLTWWEANAWPMSRINSRCWDPRPALCGARDWRLQTSIRKEKGK